MSYSDSGSVGDFGMREELCARQVSSDYRQGHRAMAYVPEFLKSPAARCIHGWMEREAPWGLKLCNGDRILGISPDEYRECSREELKGFADIAYSAARSGFAFMREEVWLPTPSCKLVGIPLEELIACMRFLRGSAFAEFIGEATGCTSIELVSVGLERYKPGHFAAFTNRKPSDDHIGFSLDLTPHWVIDWGGLRQFRDFFGCVERAYMPRFNALTIYSLAKPHSVSVVTPFALANCYALVGEFARI